MALYGYEAVNSSGKKVKGSIDVDNMDHVKAELKKQGLTPIKIQEQGALSKDIEIDIGGKPTARDLAVFCRQFVSITKAGVSILEAMRMLRDQTENKKLQKAIAMVTADVEKGETLAGAMARHTKIFPSIMINMVAAGEASGSLEVAFDRVGTQLERSSKTQALIKKAMIYPIVVALVAVAVVVIMLMFVIPSYTDMFADMGTELPGITKAVVALSDYLMANWIWIVGILVAIVVAVKTFASTSTGKHLFGKLALKIPAVSNLVTKSAASMMARTLSTLMGAGVPLIEAVEIVSGVMTNIWYQEAMLDAKTEISLGSPLSVPLEKSGLFPPLVYHMVRIGEESGNTEEMLDKLADYYDEEVEMAVQGLMAAMEPAIIIVLAAVVGVLLGSVLAPMMTMYDALDNL